MDRTKINEANDLQHQIDRITANLAAVDFDETGNVTADMLVNFLKKFLVSGNSNFNDDLFAITKNNLITLCVTLRRLVNEKIDSLNDEIDAL